MNQKEEIEKALREMLRQFKPEFQNWNQQSAVEFAEKALAGYAAATPSAPETVGQILKQAFDLHELNPIVVGETLDFPKGIITDLINDQFYTNSVPVVLFKNLLVSLHIPFAKIEAAMIPTFKIVLSKETPATIKKKPHGYILWENEESVHKYTHHLKEIMPSAPSPSIEAWLPVNSFHAQCPKCGENIDVIPPANTSIKSSGIEEWLENALSETRDTLSEMIRSMSRTKNTGDWLELDSERLTKAQSILAKYAEPRTEKIVRSAGLRSKEEMKNILVEFMRFCDDRDIKIKDNNFKYFQDYADDFIETMEEYKNQPTSKEEDKK